MACLAGPIACNFAANTTPFLDSNIGALNTKQGYNRSFLSGGVANGGFGGDNSGLICADQNGGLPPHAGGQLLTTCLPMK